jgi:betaine-aldehyde dehydrogenase
MAVETSTTYGERATALLRRSWGMLINGELVQAGNGATLDTTSPADRCFLAKVPFAQRADVNRAVEAAKAAYPSWRQTPVVVRGVLLQKMVAVLREHAQDLAIMDAIDSGNPVTSMMKDVSMACDGLEYVKGVALEVKGQTFPATTRNWLLTRRELTEWLGALLRSITPSSLRHRKSVRP